MDKAPLFIESVSQCISQVLFDILCSLAAATERINGRCLGNNGPAYPVKTNFGVRDIDFDTPHAAWLNGRHNRCLTPCQTAATTQQSRDCKGQGTREHLFISVPFRRSLRASLALLLMSTTSFAFAIGTGAITSSALSPDCLAYRVVGICYWLHCSLYECEVRTSVKVRHYVPDAVVSSFSNTGENPWTDVAFMSPANTSAQRGGDGTTNQIHENNLAKFKNADVIGHPASGAFNRFVSEFGYTCDGAGRPFTPYLLSTFDTVAWRYNIPEMFYPESLTPGLREIGSRLSANLWGNVYPRGGFLHQVDDYKSGAVVAQRAGDIVTRRGQIHVYQPLLSDERDGYWPASTLMEGDESTGKWQELVPRMSSSCSVFPNLNPRVQAKDGGYAWALWRPYSCCQRQGRVFLGHVDFSN